MLILFVIIIILRLRRFVNHPRKLSNNTGMSTMNLVLDILVVITIISSFEIVARHFQYNYIITIRLHLF